MAHNKDLKEILLECLQGTFSIKDSVRQAAEAQLSALELLDGFGVQLAEITVDPNENQSVRQLSSVLLKRFVDRHWTNLSENFVPPEVSEQAKMAIKHKLPPGLAEESFKVQSAVAYAISAIAHWDWPEKWPELFEMLINNLYSENPIVVRGVMQVLAEFVTDITDTQLPAVAPILLSVMYRVLENEKYEEVIHQRSVEVFNTLTFMITASTQDYQERFLDPVLSSYCTKFVECLSKNTEEAAFKGEILRALIQLMRKAPRKLSPIMPDVLSAVWQLIVRTSEQYVKFIVKKPQDLDTFEGVYSSVQSIISAIYDFVNTLLDSPRYRDHVKSVLPDLFYYLITFMQITAEQEHIWKADGVRYLEDMNHDTLSYSVRGEAVDLITIIGNLFKEAAYVALSEACTKHLHESPFANDNPSSWKIVEACMHAVYCSKDFVADKIKNGTNNGDLEGFIENVVIPNMSRTAWRPVYSLHFAQCLLVGCRYLEFLPPSEMEVFVAQAVRNIGPNNNLVLRITAMRAINDICDSLKGTDNVNILLKDLQSLLRDVMSFQDINSLDVLNLVVETIRSILSVDETFSSTFAPAVVDFTATVFFNHTHDQGILLLCLDMFMTLAGYPECLGPMQEKLVPAIIRTISNPPDDIPKGLCAISIDILTTLVANSKPPLSEGLINVVFPAVCHFMGKTNDLSAMRQVGECVRAFVAVSPDQVWSYQDNEGHSGLYYVLQVAHVFLDPSANENIASGVGRLLITLISKAGDMLGDHLDNLLRALLCKIQSSELLDVTEGLIVVFAHLFNTRLDVVLNFLSTIPGPDGQSALHFLLTRWCQAHPMFTVGLEFKISLMGLCNLFRHGITQNDPRLSSITVKGDRVYSEHSSGPKTRAQSSKEPEQYTYVPLLVRIIKLLINELANIMEEEFAGNTSGEETDENTETEEDSSPRTHRVIPSASSPAEKLDDTAEDDDDYDYDIFRDPMYCYNVKQYVSEFMQAVCRLPGFSEFSPYITSEETEMLKSMGILY